MSIALSRLTLSVQDYERLTRFLRLSGFKSVSTLAERLADANVIAAQEIPSNVVTMNSVIEFIDESTQETHQATLVYPTRAEPSEQRISILSPLGVQLLGMRIGDSIAWPTASGSARNYKIYRLLFQPEAAGAWHL